VPKGSREPLRALIQALSYNTRLQLRVPESIKEQKLQEVKTKKDDRHIEVVRDEREAETRRQEVVKGQRWALRLQRLQVPVTRNV
jgi:hypothetical protein